MRVVVDMNLSPDWIARLHRAGFDAQHWSQIDNPRALIRRLQREEPQF
jgi:predicted nuclease of predicted toxin-antitoxin system